MHYILNYMDRKLEKKIFILLQGFSEYISFIEVGKDFRIYYKFKCQMLRFEKS